MQREIRFRSQGVTIRGYLLLPAGSTTGGRGPPVLILSHGFSATQHMGLLDTARAISGRTGCAALTFDHAGFGESDGERHYFCHWTQATGYLDAVTYLRQVEAEMGKGFEQGEARFSFEVPLEQKVQWWHDRYRPRKPKYFNRVHTGYEWNKYNQTHYDHDNPPPKMVQGYKFAIFYPDLIDRTQTPTYQLQPDPDGAKDTCIIKFKGGPPYEDLAFKIVNREWEYAQKRGFRCVFERGILQLYFNFKRHRYRR